MSGHILSQDEVAALTAAVRDGDDMGTGPTASLRERRVSVYNFAAPIKLSPDQHYQLERLYEGYCRRASTQLSPVMRTLAEMEVVSVEQISWAESMQRLPEMFAAAIVVDAADSLQMMVCSHVDFIWHCTSRLLGGNAGLTWKSSRDHLTDIERTMADVVFDQFVRELKETWSAVLPMDMRSSGVRVDAGNARLAPAREPTVLVTIEIRFDRQSHQLSFVAPYRTLEPAAGKLVQGYLEGDDREVGGDTIEDSIGSIDIEARVEVGSAMMSMAEVMAITPGSTLSFPSTPDDGMTLYVGQQPLLYVQPGRDGTRRAIQVTDIVQTEDVA